MNPQVSPPSFAQMYAVAISVLMAWQLSHFEPWTGWTLLVVLGFYDLCAVLSPCGPLKALVSLLQKDQEEGGGRGMIPGLLYEAQVPVRGGRGAPAPPPRTPPPPALLRSLPPPALRLLPPPVLLRAPPPKLPRPPLPELELPTASPPSSRPYWLRWLKLLMLLALMVF